MAPARRISADDQRRKKEAGHRDQFMTQGLVMFDGAQRIALRNRRYCELYGLSPEVVTPGLRFATR